MQSLDLTSLMYDVCTMSLTVVGMYWRHSSMLLHTYHLSQVVCNGDVVHTLAYISLSVGGMYWRLSALEEGSTRVVLGF